MVGCNSNPAAAIEQIAVLCPDVVFSDLKMPAMDGIEMIRQLKEMELGCEFVMLSAFGTFEDSRAFFLLEGFDYILKPLQQAEIQIVLERLAARLAKKKGQTALPEVAATPAFAELIVYVSANFNNKLTLEKLGKRFNLSANYICNLFAKHYNSTLTRFITELRMKEAVRLMKETKKAYKEIAIDCGYTDYYYFCKVFKEYYGTSPTQYKAEHF